MEIKNFSQRIVNNDNPNTNGEVELYKILIQNNIIKNNLFVVGAAADFDIIKYFPNNGSKLHMFEPRKGPTQDASWSSDERLSDGWSCEILKHYLTTGQILEFDHGNKNKYNKGDYDILYFSKIVGYEDKPNDNVIKNTTINSYALGEEKNDNHIFYQNTMTMSKRQHSTTGGEHAIKVDTLDNYCFENKIDYIDFLKIDVEGHELSVLNGGKNTILGGKCNLVQFEYGGTYNDSDITLTQIYEYFKDWKIYNIESGKLNLHPTPIEDYQYTNYLASKLDLNKIIK